MRIFIAVLFNDEIKDTLYDMVKKLRSCSKFDEVRTVEGEIGLYEDI